MSRARLLANLHAKLHALFLTSHVQKGKLIPAVHTFNIKGVDLAYDAATCPLHSFDPVGRGVLDYCLSEGVDLSRPELHRSGITKVHILVVTVFSPEGNRGGLNEIRLLAGKSLWGEDETAKKANLYIPMLLLLSLLLNLPLLSLLMRLRLRQ